MRLRRRRRRRIWRSGTAVSESESDAEHVVWLLLARGPVRSRMRSRSNRTMPLVFQLGSCRRGHGIGLVAQSAGLRP